MSNTNSSIALLNLLADNFNTIGVRFKTSQGLSPKEYTYKAPKHWEFVEGDEVVVNSPIDGNVVTVVTRVDEVPKLHIDSPFQYKWVVCKVNMDAYNSFKEKEDALKEEVEKLQHKAKRERALSELMDSLGLDKKGVEKLLANLA